MCMVWPCHGFADGLSLNACVFQKVKLINHDCLPILVLLYIMLYIVLAYLMLFAALTSAVCLYNASFFCHCFLQMLFIFMLCLCLLTHSLFISFFYLHHAQCF